MITEQEFWRVQEILGFPTPRPKNGCESRRQRIASKKLQRHSKKNRQSDKRVDPGTH